ncbi:1880_t:CDS:1, partial [Ambispora gerdemannii]
MARQLLCHSKKKCQYNSDSDTNAKSNNIDPNLNETDTLIVENLNHVSKSSDYRI